MSLYGLKGAETMDKRHHDQEDELIEVCIICDVRGKEAIADCPCEIKRTVTFGKVELEELDKKWGR